MKTRHAQHGNTLVETLVSLLVLAFGSLGMAGLQGSSKQTSMDTQQRLIATYAANDILEKLYNNPAGIAFYANQQVGSGSIASAPSPNCSNGVTCSAAQIAAHDLWLWEQTIDGAATKQGTNKVGGLVQPTGCIRHDNGKVRVVVSWYGIDEIADAASSANGDTTCGNSGNHRRQLVINAFIG